MKEFLDEIGGRYIVQRVKQMINAVEADSVTKQELQAELDALDINIDLSSYATKEELTDALNNIDLSSYATKEYVTDAINNAQLDGDSSSIDLSIYAKKSDLDSKADTEHTHTMSDITDYTAPDLSSYATKDEIPSLDGYALKTEIPSLDGLATTEYVDNAIANVPTDGNVDLSNYYTKEETYSKTEVDTLVANSGDSSVPMLSMEDWIELNTQYDENVNFQNKKVYFDTSIAFRKLLNDKTYSFYLYDGDGTNMYAHNYVKYENGELTICHNNRTVLEGDTVSSYSREATIYDKTQSDGEFNPPPGRWVNGWCTTTDERFNDVLLFKGALQLNNWISTPNFGFEEADMDSYDIDGKELYHALLKSIIKIEDTDGNEIAFKTVPTQEDYLEYVNNLSGGTVDLSNYYTKDEVYSKSETDALIPTVIDGVVNGKDGVTPHIDETTKHWFIGDTDTGILAEGTNGTNGDNGVSPTVSVTETTNGHTVAITDVNSTQSFDVTNGTNGVSPTVTVTKEGKVATITCTDVNGTTTATISDGVDGQGGSSSGGSSNVYSTTETAIGTWINGSTIYRKVIEYGKLGSVSSDNQGKINISFGETIDKIINASALMSYGSTQMVVNGGYESAILVPTTSSVSAYANQIEQKKMSFISTSKTSITFYYGRGYGSYDATFIVEYTKPAQTS